MNVRIQYMETYYDNLRWKPYQEYPNALSSILQG